MTGVIDTSTGVLARVARGEAGAAEECVRRYADLVYSVARRLMGRAGAAEADDAAQEIFIDLWRSASRYDPSIASEPAFVVMIARRRVIDRIRRSARRPASVGFPESAEPVAPARAGDSPAERVATSESAAVALAAIDALSSEQQRCVRLAVQQGRTHTEIAEITGLPLGTVKTHVRRGLIRVREALDSAGQRAPIGAGGRA